MRCEALDRECNTPENDCSSCKLAEEKITGVTRTYLQESGAVIPNFKLIEEKGLITTVWFQVPIAEINKGQLKVRNQLL